MLNNILLGNVSLFLIKKEKIDLSFLYCFEHKKYVFAASQVNTLDKNYLKKYNLRHFLEKMAIEH